LELNERQTLVSSEAIAEERAALEAAQALRSEGAGLVRRPSLLNAVDSLCSSLAPALDSAPAGSARGAVRIVVRRRWLAILPALALLLWATLTPPELRSRCATFFGALVADNALTAPSAEAAADKALASLGGVHRDTLAVVTGCAPGGIGAHTAAVLAGFVGALFGKIFLASNELKFFFDVILFLQFSEWS